MVTFYRHRTIIKRLKPAVNTLTGGCLTVVLFIFISLPLQAANLNSQVDRQELSSGETLTLIVSIDEQVLFGEPDFSSLEKDFEILGRNRQNRFSNNNGKTESYTQWLLTLSPKKIGQLIIPSFSFKGEVSEAIEINVVETSASNQPDSEIFTEVTLDKSSVYVQEQALLTLRLLTAVPLRNFEKTPLNIPDAQVINISDNQYQKQVNGKDYIVVETQYAIFPENSGELNIPALRYSGIASFNYESKRIALRTEEQTLSVKPRPAEALNTSWLPARGVSLSDNWTRDKPTMTVGEPVTRNITLSARGLTAAQLPPLVIQQNEALKIYRDQAQLEDNTNAQGVIGHRIESMAIVPTESGPLTFPEIQVQWWDTVNERMRTARLPSETFDVLPGAATSPPPAEVTTTPTPNRDIIVPTVIAPAENGLILKVLIASNILLALLSLTFAVMWWHNRNSQQPESGINKTVPSPPNEKAKTTLKTVQLAAADHNYPALREAIIQWARSHWQQTNIHTLNQVASKAEDAELKRLFEELDTRLYDKHRGKVNVEASNDANPHENIDEKILDTKALIRRLETIHQRPIGGKNIKLTRLRPLYPD